MTSTFYATGSGVGSIVNNPSSTNWTTVRNTSGAGTATRTGLGYIQAAIDTGAGNVYYCERYLCPIDTSSLGASATVSAATLKVYTGGDAQHSFDMVVVKTTQASPTAIATDDYLDFGSSLVTNVVSMDATESYTLTFADLTAINTTGYSLIGLRNSHYDNENVAPDYYDGVTIKFEANKYITLTVTYTKPEVGSFLLNFL